MNCSQRFSDGMGSVIRSFPFSSWTMFCSESELAGSMEEVLADKIREQAIGLVDCAYAFCYMDCLLTLYAALLL